MLETLVRGDTLQPMRWLFNARNHVTLSGTCLQTWRGVGGVPLSQNSRTWGRHQGGECVDQAMETLSPAPPPAAGHRGAALQETTRPYCRTQAPSRAVPRQVVLGVRCCAGGQMALWQSELGVCFCLR